MADGTKEDYALLDRLRGACTRVAARPPAGGARRPQESFAGYQVTRYEHSLQAATRALRDGRDEEYVVATLLHDIGDELAPVDARRDGGGDPAAVRAAEICWMVKHHGVFQLYYYAHHSGGDRNARDRYRDHPYYDACVEFCEQYDQNCFDPDYDWLPSSSSSRWCARVFAEPRYLETAET